MATERPAAAGKSLWVNNLMMSVLRIAGYDLNCCSAASTSSSSSSAALASASASVITRTTAQEMDNPDAVGVGGGESMHPLPVDLESTRALLEGYSGIPAGDVARHVYQIRDRLWDVYPDPCVGRFRFASLDFAADAYYQVALFKLLQAQAEEEAAAAETMPTTTTRLLDVGCCVGQVLRKLAFDGVESSRLLGTDIEPRFLDIGYDLFRDRDTFRGEFVFGDLLLHNNNSDDENVNENSNDNDDPLAALDGKATFVHATSFFHLFTWDDQVRAACRIVRFLRPPRARAPRGGRAWSPRRRSRPAPAGSRARCGR